MKEPKLGILDLSHAEARRLLATGAPVFVPVNPVEYHGPHLSLHNDALISAGLIRDLHASLATLRPDWPLLAVADLEVGVEPTPGPGSRPVSFPVVRRLVEGTCRTLVELGAKGIVLVTFHGNPLHGLALDAGVRLSARRGVPAIAPLHLLLAEMLVADGRDYAEAVGHVPDAAEREAMLGSLPLDFHAGFFETSLSLHYAPDSVHARYRDLPPCPTPTPDGAMLRASRAASALGATRLARELSLGAAATGWTRLRPFPAYTGRPHRATATSGAYFARKILELFLPAVRGVLLEGAAPPQPIMSWLATVTLGGRIGSPTVPLSEILVELPAEPPARLPAELPAAALATT